MTGPREENLGAARAHSVPSVPFAARGGRPPVSSKVPATRSRIWLALAALLLSGCARKFEPPVHPLSLSAPANWAGGSAVSGTSIGHWWDYLEDPGLDSAIATALEHNQDLKAAAARLDAAQAEALIAGAAAHPNIDLNLASGRQRQNFVGFPIPGREGQVLSTTFNTAGVNLGLSWELDVWGRMRDGQAAALATTEARQAEVRAARLSLSGQVAKAWFAAREARRQAELARATLASYETSAGRVRERFQRGLRPSLDLRLALTEVDRARALVGQREAQLDAAVRQLEILLGDYPSGEYALASGLPSLPRYVPEGLPAELVHRRPDLLAGESAVLASDARLSQSRAALRPRISLTSSFGTASAQLRDLLNHNLLAWNFLSNLMQPIYNRGRLKASIEREEAVVREAVARYESAVLRAYGEVEITLAAERMLARQEAALEAATQHSLAAKNLAEDRYRKGLANIITVLTAQRAALDSESRWLTLRRLRLENRVNLHLALGGGFEEGSAAGPQPSSTVKDRKQEGDS